MSGSLMPFARAPGPPNEPSSWSTRRRDVKKRVKAVERADDGPAAIDVARFAVPAELGQLALAPQDGIAVHRVADDVALVVHAEGNAVEGAGGRPEQMQARAVVEIGLLVGLADGVRNFNGLREGEKQDLLNFLRSL
jgi:hypothetical protein